MHLAAYEFNKEAKSRNRLKAIPAFLYMLINEYSLTATGYRQFLHYHLGT